MISLPDDDLLYDNFPAHAFVHTLAPAHAPAHALVTDLVSAPAPAPAHVHIHAILIEDIR